MIKKFVAVTAVILIAASLVSCKTTKVGKQVDSTTEISMLFMEPGNAPYKDDWLILQEIAKRKNVKLNLQVVPGRDYTQKRQIVFASGELPDIIVNCWPDQMSQYAADGVLLPVSDYLDKLPNLKTVISEWDLQDTIKNISEMDGKFYVLPDFRKELSGTQCFAIREDIFKANNIPVPETYEDLFNALVKLKKVYPDSLGFGDGYQGKMFMSFIPESFNTNGGFSIPYGYSYHFENDEWYYAPTSNEYKTFLTYMNKLAKNGCLDPEAFTQDTKQAEQKTLNNKYFVTVCNGPQDAKRTTIELQKLGNSNAKMTAIYPLAGPTGLRKVKPSSKNQGGLAMPASVAKRKDFDKVLAFCDWLYYSEEGAILTSYGVEGVTYDKKDGQYVLKPDIKSGANPNGTIELQKEYGLGGLQGLYTLVPDRVPEEAKKANADPEQYTFDRYIKDHDMETPDDPIIKMTADQRERSKLLITKLNDYSNNMIMKFIYGQESFDNWGNYVQECNKKGAQELLEIVRTAWKENRKK